MKTLDQIKLQVANEKAFVDWHTLTNHLPMNKYEEAFNEVAERYKIHGVRSILDRAAERATAQYRYRYDEWGMNKSLQAYVVKDSILDLKPKLREEEIEYEVVFTKTDCTNCDGHGYLVDCDDYLKPRCCYCNADGKAITQIVVPKKKK